MLRAFIAFIAFIAFMACRKMLQAHVMLELLLLVVSFSISPDLHTASIAGTSCLHGFHRLHGLASMLPSAFGKFAHKTPTEQNQIQRPVLHVR